MARRGISEADVEQAVETQVVAPVRGRGKDTTVLVGWSTSAKLLSVVVNSYGDVVTAYWVRE